ncbi:MAG TPA: HPF/RaiA family ribosome-associated protein [Gemmatimonadales bacterium]|nr:HPF/RaiA family ribosome-associated protein [Gemmatimonadales bacterium]
MQTTITARHRGDVPEDLRELARDLLGRLSQIAVRPHRAQVVFDTDHGRKVVEVQVSLPRGQVCVASAEAGDYRTALDRAGAKLRRQLRRSAGRRQDRKAP